MNSYFFNFNNLAAALRTGLALGISIESTLWPLKVAIFENNPKPQPISKILELFFNFNSLNLSTFLTKFVSKSLAYLA